MKFSKALQANSHLYLAIAIALLYVIIFLFFDCLQSSPIWDEGRYWQTILRFSQQPLPNVQLLKSYGELNTPLPFIIYGWLEHLFQEGIFAGRLLNLMLSLAMTYLIGRTALQHDKTSLLALLGLLLFPYYLWSSSHLYTDIIATFFVFLGFWYYQRERHVLSCLSFILAIASRQYMLAFPLAIAAHELVLACKTAFRRGETRKPGFKLNLRWVAPAIAASSILGWVLLFGGLAPQTAFNNQSIQVPAVQQHQWALGLDASLYFLSCLGFYFVMPEWLLFNCKNPLQNLALLIFAMKLRGGGARRAPPPLNFIAGLSNAQNLMTRKNCCLACCLVILFIVFPPLDTHGLLSKGLDFIPADFLKVCILYGLALLAACRFAHFNLAFWIVLMNCGIMLKAYPWEKYLLPVLVVIWYLKAHDQLDTK